MNGFFNPFMYNHRTEYKDTQAMMMAGICIKTHSKLMIIVNKVLHLT